MRSKNQTHLESMSETILKRLVLPHLARSEPNTLLELVDPVGPACRSSFCCLPFRNELIDHPASNLVECFETVERDVVVLFDVMERTCESKKRQESVTDAEKKQSSPLELTPQDLGLANRLLLLSRLDRPRLSKVSQDLRHPPLVPLPLLTTHGPPHVKLGVRFSLTHSARDEFSSIPIVFDGLSHESPESWCDGYEIGNLAGAVGLGEAFEEGHEDLVESVFETRGRVEMRVVLDHRGTVAEPVVENGDDAEVVFDVVADVRTGLIVVGPGALAREVVLVCEDATMRRSVRVSAKRVKTFNSHPSGGYSSPRGYAGVST